MLFYLPITISSMEQCFEMCLSCFYIFYSIRKILNCLAKVHESGIYESSIEIVETVCWLEGDGLLELSESIIYLVEHHHAVTSVGIVLCLLVIESDCSPEIIHGFLIMSYCHKGIPPICVVFRMNRSFVARRSTL